MLAPSDDWPALSPSHAQHATFRAIENGYSLVRETNNGVSLAVDYEGRVLSSADYFASDHHTMVASVPTHGARTVYATIGDLFAWLCIVGLAALIGLTVRQ